MGAAGEVSPRHTARADVLTELRTATAVEHEQVETTLGLMDDRLGRDRLVAVLARLHAFWAAAEAGLDAWARHWAADAETVAWSRRRRAHLFAADPHALGAEPDAAPLPGLPAVEDTDQALGRLYVLEGATLGGIVISRHLATLPALGPDVRLGAFSPYGPETGAMWHAFRRVTRDRVAAGGDAGRPLELRARADPRPRQHPAARRAARGHRTRPRRRAGVGEPRRPGGRGPRRHAGPAAARRARGGRGRGGGPLGQRLRRPAGAQPGYTDGLVERRDRVFDLGVERLADELVAVRERPLQAACDELIGRMLPEGTEDDVALAAVRLRG